MWQLLPFQDFYADNSDFADLDGEANSHGLFSTAESLGRSHTRRGEWRLVTSVLIMMMTDDTSDIQVSGVSRNLAPLAIKPVAMCHCKSETVIV